MKKSFMTRALAMGLSLAMAFSLSAATNVSVASAAATPAMASKQFAVRVGGAAKSYKASAATQKSFKITKATVGNTDKATVKVNSSKKSIKVTPGTVTGTTVVKVTFKNIKTAKTTAKKYRCVVKAALEDPKPVEPEVVKATKITEAKVSTAKTMTVTFDGAVDTSSATAIKVMRGSTEAPVTAAYASDSKSVVLTSATPFAAGTYTITVGSFEPATVAVVKQTPTKLEILNTTVANVNDAPVSFQVLDQYGEPMADYTGKKLTVQAYNTTKGHNIKAVPVANKAIFKLDCATQAVSGSGLINAIDDTINVVAYLTDNAGVSATATLKIANIYMETLEIGEPELGTDKRVTVGKTYKLPYTAKTNEGNDTTFGEDPALAAVKVTRVFGNYTFVTSNASAVDMGKFYVDKDGQMFFTAETTPGTAVITTINNMTGTASSFTIVVNDVPKMSSLDVADTSIAWDTNKSYSEGTYVEVKAAVTVYDQFGEVVDPKNVRNIGITGAAGDPYFSGVTIIPNTSGITVKGISNDGKYLVYKVDGDESKREKLKGQTITFNFTSKAAGTTGYITSNSKVTISDTIEPAALTIVTDPAATVVSGKSISVKFSVYDQNQNKLKLTDADNKWTFITSKINDSTPFASYSVEIEDPSGLFKSVKTGKADDDKKEYELKLEAKLTNVAETDIAKAGQFTLNLKESTRRLTSKNYNLSVIKPITDYVLTTNATKYSSGDKVTVDIDAYSEGGKLFNSLYNETVKMVIIDDNSKTSTKDVVFKNGSATIELTAGTAAASKNVSVKKQDETTVAGTSNNYKVVANSAKKLAIKGSDLVVQDSAGNTINHGWPETTYAKITVMDKTLNKDITKVVSIGGVNATVLGLRNDNTFDVVIEDTGSVVTYGAGNHFDMVEGIGVNIPTASVGHDITITISINGMEYSVSEAGKNITTAGNYNVTDKTAVQNATDAVSLATANATADYNALLAETFTAAAKVASNGGVVTIKFASGSSIGTATAATSSAVAVVTGSGSTFVTDDAITVAPKIDGTTKQMSITIKNATNAKSGDKIEVTYDISITGVATVNEVTKYSAPLNKTIKVTYTYDGSQNWTVTVDEV